jgi:hypothetical protein
LLDSQEFPTKIEPKKQEARELKRRGNPKLIQLTFQISKNKRENCIECMLILKLLLIEETKFQIEKLKIED